VQRRASRLEREQLDGVEARDRVLPPQAFVVAGEGLEPARHHHPVARLEESQLAGSVPAGGDEHGAASGGTPVDPCDADEHACVVLLTVGIADQRRRDRRRSACVPRRRER
jgi:hypothetical protein